MNKYPTSYAELDCGGPPFATSSDNCSETQVEEEEETSHSLALTQAITSLQSHVEPVSNFINSIVTTTPSILPPSTYNYGHLTEEAPSPDEYAAHYGLFGHLLAKGAMCERAHKALILTIKC